MLLRTVLRFYISLTWLALALSSEVLAQGQPPDLASLVHPEVAERLSLDDAQRATLQQLLQARADVAAAAPDAASKAQASKEAEQKILAVLTEEQRKKFMEAPAQAKLMFQFRDMKWDDVLNWFAQQQDLTLVMDRTPAGTFTYSDTRAYSPSEGIDLLNSVLMTRNFALVRREKMLVVMELSDSIPLELLPRVTLQQLPERGRFELVSVMFALAGRPMDAVLQEVKPYLSSYGRAIPLAQSGQLLVIETAGKMQTINELIASVPLPKQPPQPEKPAPPPKPVFAAYPLGQLDAAQALETVRKLIPSEQITVNAKTGVLSAYVIPDQQTAIKTAIDQMISSATALPATESVAYQFTGIAPIELTKQVSTLAPQAIVTTTADRLLVIASPDDQRLIQTSLAAINVLPVTGEKSMQLFEVEQTLTTQIEAALKSFLPQSQIAANANGSLIVRGSPADLKTASEIIEAWQRFQSPSQMQLRAFPLDRVADAVWLATVQRIVPAANTWLDTEGKQLMLLGKPTDVAAIETMLPQLLSLLPQPDDRRLQIYNLSKNQLSRRATLAPAELPKSLASVKLVDGTNPAELLVWASAEQHAEFAKVLAGIDLPSPQPLQTFPKTYPIEIQEHALAVQILTTEFPEAKITANSDGKVLTVVADEASQSKIEARVSLFNEQLTKREELTLESYSVRGMTAAALQTALTPVLSTARVHIDTDRNRLLVTTDQVTHREVAKLVAALAEEIDVDHQKVIVAHTLKHSQATQLKTVLDQLLTGATVLADDKLKQLVVTGTLAQQATVKSTIDQIDRAAAEGEQVEIRTFETKKLQAAILLPTLQKLWPNLEMSSDTSANRIIATGTDLALKQLGEAIERLNSSPDGKAQFVKTYPVPAGEMSSLSTILSQIAPQAIISIDLASRTITVWAAEDQQARVQEAIEQISQTAAGAKEPATYLLKPTQLVAVQTALQTLFPSVGIASVPTSGQLIVIASKEQQQRIAEVIELLTDGPNAAENTVKVFRVDPQRVQLSDLLLALQNTLPAQIRLQSNPLNNTLLAIGTPQELELVTSKVALLEQQLPAPETRTSVVYPLQFGSSSSALTILQSLVPRAILAQDLNTRTVAATANAEDHLKIAEFLKSFDVPKRTELETRVYRLTRGSARGLQYVLTELLPEATIYGSREERVLIATATPEQHTRIADIVSDFDKEEPNSETRVFPIGKSSSASLRLAVQEMAAEARVTSDAASNSLIVTASAEDMKRIVQVVEEVEAGGATPRETRFLAVTNADPSSLSRALKDSFPKADFSADAVSGGVFATATAEEHTAIHKLVENLSSQPTRLPTLKAFVLKHADPETVASAIETAFGRRSTLGVSFSRESHSVFVVGSNHELQVATQLVEQLDVLESTDGGPIMRLFALGGGVEGESVADSIESLFRGSVPKVNISYDELNNRLYVTGDDKQLKMVEDALAQLAPPKRELEIIRLDTTDPYTFKQAAEALFSDEPQNDAPQVTVDGNLQQVLVRATPEQLQRLRQLLLQMGEASAVDSTVSAGRLRFVPVHRNSAKLLEQIQRLWPSMRANPLQIIDPSGITPKPEATPAIGPTSSLPAANSGKVKLASAPAPILQTTSLQTTAELTPPGPAANSSPIIVVTGEDQWTLASDDTAALEQFGRLLDSLLSPVATPFATTGNFSIYLLRHAGAEQVQELLSDLFRPSDRSLRSTATDVFQRVKIVADTRINGLIVSGNRGDRKVVEELLGVLDSAELLDTLQQVTPTVVQMVSASAQSVANVIENVYRSQLSAGGGRRPIDIPEGVTTSVAIVLQQLNAQATGPLLTIAVDETTNSIVLRAPVDLTTEIKAFIEKLDLRAVEAPGRRVQLLRLESTNTKNLEKAMRLLIAD